MSEQGFILAPASIIVDFVLDPVRVVLHSYQLINLVEQFSGFDQWIVDTYHDLTPEQRAHHSIAMGICFDCLTPTKNWTDFEKYMDYIETMDPVLMRDTSLASLADKEDFPGAEALLNDKALYLDFLRAAYEHKEMVFDEELHSLDHDYLNDPVALKDLVISHMRFMWDNFMSQEWARVKGRLQESIDAHRQVDYSGMDYYEIIEAVTGRNMRKHEPESDISHIILMPSPHIGPYIGWFPTNKKNESRIFFGARLPKGTQTVSLDWSRSELLIRLNALADDTRLQMLELLTESGELCAQDFINVLNLSQSSASRHLRQLTASGYITERRRDVAKCYSLNYDKIDDTVSALKTFLGKRQ